MLLQETYYDILDLPPNSTPQEVREAYLRLKATFNRDSLALYTLVSTEEREETLKKIEEAYYTLSNTERRRQYDQSYGHLSSLEESGLPKRRPNLQSPTPQEDHSAGHNAVVISIDRTAPMETLSDSENFLVAPTTDFTSQKPPSHTIPQTGYSAAPAPVAANAASSSRIGTEAFSIPSQTPIQGAPKPLPSKEIRSPGPALDAVLYQAIEMETEWRGSFLKRIREAYKISLEEMASITKVTKTYLTAIEEENYSKLPAAVYIRGFIIQVAKVLKLPHEKVASAYLTRYRRTHEAS